MHISWQYYSKRWISGQRFSSFLSYVFQENIFKICEILDNNFSTESWKCDFYTIIVSKNSCFFFHKNIFYICEFVDIILSNLHFLWIFFFSNLWISWQDFFILQVRFFHENIFYLQICGQYFFQLVSYVFDECLFKFWSVYSIIKYGNTVNKKRNATAARPPSPCEDTSHLGGLAFRCWVS